MNSHKNARLTFEGRKLLIERIAVMGLVPAAQAAGISVRTARKWRLDSTSMAWLACWIAALGQPRPEPA